MERTPESYIRKQERRRREGKVIPPCVSADGQLRTLRITTAYRKPGPRTQWSLGYHTGEDHAAVVGSLANAVSWGRVIAIFHWSSPGSFWSDPRNEIDQWGDSYGTHVIVRTKDGEHDYALCHLSKTIAQVGWNVRPGQTLGHVGHSGGSGTFGPHLHFEARTAGGRFGSDVNPIRVKQMRG